jgi:hypothetical protein
MQEESADKIDGLLTLVDVKEELAIGKMMLSSTWTTKSMGVTSSLRMITRTNGLRSSSGTDAGILLG